jgi:hypothetical protein
MAEFQWTINFFNARAEAWDHHSISGNNGKLPGHACYASRQKTIYSWLREQCKVAWESLHTSAQGRRDLEL